MVSSGKLKTYKHEASLGSRGLIPLAAILVWFAGLTAIANAQPTQKLDRPSVQSVPEKPTQSDSPLPSQLKPTASPQPEAAPSGQSETEIAVLKAQLEMMREYNDRILGTVTLCVNILSIYIGVLVAIGALLFGFSWLQTRRDHEELKEQVRRILKPELKDFVEKRLESEFEEIRQDQKLIRYELLEWRADRAEAERNYMRALNVHVERLQVAQKFASRDVSAILNDIERLLRTGTNVDDFLVDTLLEDLKGLPDRYRSQIDIIQGLLQTPSIIIST